MVLQKLKLSTGDRTRKPRTVWNNPVAWREAKTKGSATRATLLRWSFITVGISGAVTLVWLYSTVQAPKFPDYVDANSYNPSLNYLTVYGPDSAATTLAILPDTVITLNDPTKVVGPEALNHHLQISATASKNKGEQMVGWATLNAYDIPRLLDANQARDFLLGATVVELAVILLIVTNVAASTVTREKEDGTLDILLTTPITSRFYIWGKLRGLVSFVLPLVAVPVASVGIFVVHDLFQQLVGGHEDWIAYPEALLIMPATLIIVCAFASIVGMQMSLRARRSVVAVMSSVGIVAGLCGVIAFCGFQVLQNNSHGDVWFGAVIGSFSPFMLMAMQIDPSRAAPLATMDSGGRALIFIFGWIAVAAYAALVAAMYRSMVKNFDMTIRKQSR